MTKNAIKDKVYGFLIEETWDNNIGINLLKQESKIFYSRFKLIYFLTLK